MAELSTLARPYAKAVFELARDSNSFADWGDQLAALSAAAGHPDMVTALKLPGVLKSQIAELMLAALKGQLQPQGESLVRLLADNGRLQAAADLASQFEALRAEAEARVEVEITSAASIGEAEKAKLSSAVAKKLNRAVDIVWNIDESLIAGAKIRAGDLVIDGSAAGELERLKTALTR